MDKNIIDMKSPRERFFGWFPREKTTKIFILFNFLYFVFCCFIWPRIPSKLVFGFWPIHHLVANVFIASWAAIMWGLYYYKFWPLLGDGYEENESNREEVKVDE